MSNLSIFKFENHPVRIEIKENQPWFCLKYVSNILQITRVSDLRNRMKSSGTGYTRVSINGHSYRMVFIDEPNLYRAIFQSTKPEAEKFQDWVFEEVLPHIRKTGSYQERRKVETSRRVTGWEIEGLKSRIHEIAYEFFGFRCQAAENAMLTRLKYELNTSHIESLDQEEFDKAYQIVCNIYYKAEKMADYFIRSEEHFITCDINGVELDNVTRYDDLKTRPIVKL